MKELSTEIKLKLLRIAIDRITKGQEFICGAIREGIYNETNYGFMRFRDIPILFPEFKDFILAIGRTFRDNYEYSEALIFPKLNYTRTLSMKTKMLRNWLKYIEKTGSFKVDAKILKVTKEYNSLCK